MAGGEVFLKLPQSPKPRVKFSGKQVGFNIETSSGFVSVAKCYVRASAITPEPRNCCLLYPFRFANMVSTCLGRAGYCMF